jgi:hypothetical protein
MSLSVERNRETSYERSVRWSVFAACCVLSLSLGLAGCFKPDVKNGGFACSMADNPPCPQGFFCVAGLCQDHPGSGNEPVDLATGTGGNGGGGGGGGGGGSTVFDMSHPAQDLSSTDMAQSGGSCGAQFDPCTADSDCCNKICFTTGGAGFCFL